MGVGCHRGSSEPPVGSGPDELLVPLKPEGNSLMLQMFLLSYFCAVFRGGTD